MIFTILKKLGKIINISSIENLVQKIKELHQSILKSFGNNLSCSSSKLKISQL